MGKTTPSRGLRGLKRCHAIGTTGGMSGFLLGGGGTLPREIIMHVITVGDYCKVVQRFYSGTTNQSKDTPIRRSASQKSLRPCSRPACYRSLSLSKLSATAGSRLCLSAQGTKKALSPRGCLGLGHS